MVTDHHHAINKGAPQFNFPGGSFLESKGGSLLPSAEVKEQQLGLFADRTSTATMRGNQLRLYFSSMAYILMHDLRRLALKGTELERAQCTTIRLKVLKIGAQVHVTVRRVWIRMAAGYPYKEAFQQAFDNLQQIPLRC